MISKHIDTVTPWRICHTDFYGWAKCGLASKNGGL